MSLPHPSTKRTDETPTPRHAPGRRWNPHAAVAAWALPGLGHYLLGERRRAVILAAAIGLLWVGGVLVGGISVCNRSEHPAWFIGQMLVGPSWALDRYHHHLRADALSGGAPAYEPSYGAVSEQGILYTALAGLLNLLAIIDVLYRDPDQIQATPPTPAENRPG